MPLFLRTREPLRQEKLILGGAVTYRPRHHRLHAHRYPMKVARHNVRAIKPVAAAAAAASTPKQARRRGVTNRRRPPARKQHPIPQRRRQRPKKRTNPPKKKRPSKQTTMKVNLNKGKLKRTVSSTAKQVLNQLAKSRQIRRAVKGVAADINLPNTGRQLLNHAVSSVVNKSRKRPVEAMLEEQQQQESPAKRARFQSGYSRMGYRSKKIHRGGTTQQLGGAFLF